MKKVKVKIIGTSPMLIHRFGIEKDEKANKKDKIYDPKEECEKSLYKDEKLGCYLPSSMIEATMREASKEFKKGKKTYKETILSSVFCEDEKIPLNKKTYDEIDTRPVVIQRNRVVKSRPKFNPGWQVEFIVNYNEDKIEPKILKQILEEAGITKGVGTYRPKFGRFKVAEFKEI